MRILAIETATASGSVALLERARVIAERAEYVPQRHLEWLAPAIRHVLTEAGWRPCDVAALAVSIGPGSFTGLRIGIATASAWAHARRIPIVGVSTLETLAAGVGAAGVICAVLDVRRGEVAAALFERNGALRRLDDDFVGSVDALLARLPRDRPVVFAGDGARRYGETLRGHPAARVAPEDEWIPRASVTGQRGWERLERGDGDDPYLLHPIYARAAVTVMPAPQGSHPFGDGREPG